MVQKQREKTDRRRRKEELIKEKEDDQEEEDTGDRLRLETGVTEEEAVVKLEMALRVEVEVQ